MKLKWTRLAGVVLVLPLLLYGFPTKPASAAAIFDNVSTNASGQFGNGNGWRLEPHISQDGRFVTFMSGSDNLVPGDTNGRDDIFRKDLSDGSIIRINLDASGNQQTDPVESRGFSVSEDGNRILFSARFNVTNDSVLWLRDVAASTTTLVSVSNTGELPDTGTTGAKYLSPDGNYAVFTSTAVNLDPGVTTYASRVYLRDMLTNTTSLLPLATPNNGEVYPEAISEDGRYIVYGLSYVVHEQNSTFTREELYTYDSTNGTIRGVSESASGVASNHPISRDAVITPDGRYVAFYSGASNLTSDITNQIFNIFVKDTTDGSVRLASIGPGDTPGNEGSHTPSISDDGRYVSFDSAATNLITPQPIKPPKRVVYVHDMQTQRTQRVTQSDVNETYQNDNFGGDTISGNGQYVTFVALDKVYRRSTGNMFTLFAPQVTAENPCKIPFLEWDEVPAADHYDVYRVGAGKLASVTNKFYGDFATSEGVYQYYVVPMYGTEAGPASNTLTIQVDKTSPVISDVQWSQNPLTPGQNTTISFVVQDALSNVDWGFVGITKPSGEEMEFLDVDFNAQTGRWQAVVGQTLPVGTYDVLIEMYDHAGNFTHLDLPGALSVAITGDTTGPSISGVSWSANPLQHGQNTTLTVIANDTSGVNNVTYTVNGGLPQSMVYNPISNTWTAILGSTLAVDTYPIVINAVDGVGNTGTPLFDLLVVSDVANGSLSGHDKLLPTVSDTMPIARDTGNNPAKMTVGFTNVMAAGTAPASGSVDLQYVIKNNKDEFSYSSSVIDWLTVPNATHASVLSHGTLTYYVNSVQTVVQNVAVRIDVTLGTNGSPDHLTISIFNPGINPTTGTPTYRIDDNAIINGSTTTIRP